MIDFTNPPGFGRADSPKMRGTGFEPAQALSYNGLNVARLTTPAYPRSEVQRIRLINISFVPNHQEFFNS